MRKVFLSIEDCKPGMQIAETIYNEYGAVIVAEYTVLDKHLINKINHLGFFKIKVYEQRDHFVMADHAELFKAQYRENVDTVKSILQDISGGKNVDLEKINYVSESIVVRINENRDIVRCINQMKNMDEYTYTHSVNVSLLSMLIGKWMRYEIDKIRELVQAGLLHDIGKSRVSAEVLNKPGALSYEEFEEMKRHPVYGYRIVESIKDLTEDVRKAILMHHEREDGSGYPVGLKSDQISNFAKIIAVADIYDAMTSKRVYKEKESPFQVFKLMEENMFGILDIRIVKVFLANIAAYYIGDAVRLNTGEAGEIIYINPMHISQPLLKTKTGYIDLSVEPKVNIVEMI